MVVVALLLVVMYYPTIVSTTNGGGTSMPQNVKAETGMMSNVLSWDPVPGATHYKVYWSTSPIGSTRPSTYFETQNSTVVHDSLTPGQTYYYLVTAVGPKGESKVSSAASATPRRPIVSGTAIPPQLNFTYPSKLPCNGLKSINLYDLGGSDPIITKEGSDPSFSFEVDAGKNYKIYAFYNGGQVIMAYTPEVKDDLNVNVSLDSEVAANLIITTESVNGAYDETQTSRDLDLLLADADEAVARLNRFREQRDGGSLLADRLTDAVRSITINQLNKETSASPSNFNVVSVRAFGGGLGGIRNLTEILTDPLPPLIPYVLFTRFNSKDELDFGMSALDARKWDYIGSLGWQPNMAVGGDKVACIMPVSFDDSVSPTRYFWGIKVKTLGTTEDWQKLTPDTLDCLAPCISPSQSRIVFTARDITNNIGVSGSLPPYNLYTIDIDGTDLTQITFDTDLAPELDMDKGCLGPAWSPDGSRIVFTTFEFNREGDNVWPKDNVELIDPDGSDRHLLWDGRAFSWRYPQFARYSPDGESIMFSAVEEAIQSREILIIPSDFDQYTKPYYSRLTNNSYNELNPSWCFNGRYILYSSNQGGEMGYVNGEPVELAPFYLANRWTGRVVTAFGNFAEAGRYFTPSLTGTCFSLKAKPGVTVDDAGNVVIDPGSVDERKTDGHSDGGAYYGTQNINSYYREIIPAANNIGVNFGVTDW